MSSKWLESVKSSIPRGFSRCYVIEILREGPHTGKEIINRAIQDSNGRWSPSPGLIYPLLGRLHDEGIIAEINGGEEEKNKKKNTKYTLTKKGIETTEDIRKISEGIKNQIDIVCRLGDAGKFVAADMIERIASIGYMINQNNDGSSHKNSMYRQFLIDELNRIDGDKDTIKNAKKQTLHKTDDNDAGQKIKVK